MVKAGAFDAEDLKVTNYNDSRDITGNLSNIFHQTLSFIISNLRHVQGKQGINSLGEPEIPRESIEELVSNALIHRDYFIPAPIRVFVFSDRVEIISPGHLPNNLTVENIKSGNSNARNPVLASFANHVMPYRGYGI
jgi:ATP-dependent DNA helicase RecG